MLRRRNFDFGAFCRGLRRIKAAVRSSDGVRRSEIEARRSVLGICDIRHGLVHRNAAFALVHNNQNIAGMDQLALVDLDLLYLSIDPGAHRRDVSVNVRVIRAFIEYGITNEKSRTHGYYYASDITTIILCLSRDVGRYALASVFYA